MLLSIISAILLILAFPDFNLSYLVFIAFVPLFFALHNESPKRAFWIAYLCGFFFYLGTLYWLYHVTFIGLIILCLYLALYFGIFGLCIFKLTAYSLQLTAIPLIWSFLEYIQAHLFTGFGWCLLGYSQYKNLPLIQIADFSGVYGVSFVIMMVNVIAWKLSKGITEYRVGGTGYRRKSLFPACPEPCRGTKSRACRGVLCSLLSLVLIFAVVHGYGFLKLSDKEVESNSISVSVIQGNISQEIKWVPEEADAILKKYINLTRQAVFDRSDLIIWPETAFPGFFVTDKELSDEVLNLAKEIKTPILLGANTEKGLNIFNSVVLISEKGEIVDKYDKLHLVPFGEYVPFSARFPILHNLILGELGEFTAGNDFKIFTLQHQASSIQPKFSALICFEDIFPALAKRFVKEGAQFLVVITNDAWYGKSGAPYQHAACSVFRAIENRVPVARCTNTGYSCFIDSRGRIYDSVEKDRTHLFISGYKTSKINLQ